MRVLIRNTNIKPLQIEIQYFLDGLVYMCAWVSGRTKKQKTNEKWLFNPLFSYLRADKEE